MARQKNPLNHIQWEESQDFTDNDKVADMENQEDDSSPFLENIFTQAREIINEENDTSSVNIPNEKVEVLDKKFEDGDELTREDVQALLDFGFEIPIAFTDYEGWKLTTKQAEMLARRWHPIIKRFAPRIKNFNMILALIVSAEIITEKTIEYRKFKSTKTSTITGNEGTRENKSNEIVN